MYLRAWLAILLATSLSGCFLFGAEAPPAEAPRRCGPEEDEFEGACITSCGEGLQRDAAGECVLLCQPDCEGKACLADDGCGAPCAADCVRVARVAVTPAQELALQRDAACVAFDAPSGSFLLYGGRRNTNDRTTIGPGLCRLPRGPDDLVPVEGGEQPQSTACGLPRACWESSCVVPEGWENTSSCEHCSFEDLWRLAQDGDGVWSWSKLAVTPEQPSPQDLDGCLSLGGGGVGVRGTDFFGVRRSWRWDGENLRVQPTDDQPPPPLEPYRARSRHLWSGVGCAGGAPCELLIGGCGGLTDDGAPIVTDLVVPSVTRVEVPQPPSLTIPEAIWLARMDPAAVATGDAVWVYGGAERHGTCNQFFEPGSRVLGDLLRWDGSTWERLDLPAGHPMNPREGGRLGALGERIVLFGGRLTAGRSGKDEYPAELCETTQAPAWACRYSTRNASAEFRVGTPTDEALPQPRFGHAMASGVDRDGRPVIVIFGGSEAAERGDTWIVELPR